MLLSWNFLLAVQVGFEYPSYLVAEDSGNVSVCATLTGQLARDVTVTLSTSDETAMGEPSVFFRAFRGGNFPPKVLNSPPPPNNRKFLLFFG